MLIIWVITVPETLSDILDAKGQFAVRNKL
jgi:hypothetical protein